MVIFYEYIYVSHCFFFALADTNSVKKKKKKDKITSHAPRVTTGSN